MKPLRISVLLPRPTGFYRGLLPQMLSGFRAAGFEANGTCDTLDEAGVLNWCREHRTDVVFDMNRTRSQLPELPRHVRHVTWIVDYLGRTDDQIKGSDITYFFTTGWVASFPHSSFVDWFPPGSCTDTYAPSGASFESDAAVAGHVPPPWSASELSRNVSKTERPFSFGELVEQFQAWVQALRDDDEATHSSYWSAANRIVRAATGDDITDDPTIRYDLLGRLPRTGLRKAMVSEVLNAGRTLRIYGTKGWTAWPDLAPHYRGFLEQPSELARAYESSRFNLHEGEGMHFRSMDCLATGGLLFYCTKRKSIDFNGGWHSIPFGARVNDDTRPLVAGRHYVEYYPGELAQKAKYYLERPALCDKLRQNAREAIHESHTWRHRAQKVAADLARI